jgi:hypothetical protein
MLGEGVKEEESGEINTTVDEERGEREVTCLFQMRVSHISSRTREHTDDGILDLYSWSQYTRYT